MLLRKTISGKPIENSNEKGVFFAFWHGKMLAGWLLSKSLFPKKNHLAVVSQSKDGQLLANALEALKFSLIRGSSSKGSEAIKAESKKALQSLGVVAITPDGPRGPRETLKYGLIRMASETQTPIVFAKISYRDSWAFKKSWDRFEIPKPFSKVNIDVNRIDVPLFETEEALKAFTLNLSETLKSDQS